LKGQDAMTEVDAVATTPTDCFTWLSDLTGWSQYGTFYVNVSLLACWMTLGTFYAMYYENFDKFKSVTFAMGSTMSNGLISPICHENIALKECEMGSDGVIIGFYLLVGVPLYIFAMLQFANIIVRRRLLAREIDILNTPFKDRYFSFSSELLSLTSKVAPDVSSRLNDINPTETLDISEFVIVECLRIGKVDRPVLKQIADLFREIDTKSLGILSKDNLIKKGLLLPPE